MSKKYTKKVIRRPVCTKCDGKGELATTFLESCSNCGVLGWIASESGGEDICPVCDGAGQVSVTKSDSCESCDGRGYDVRIFELELSAPSCTSCVGTGKLFVDTICSNCGGAGGCPRPGKHCEYCHRASKKDEPVCPVWEIYEEGWLDETEVSSDYMCLQGWPGETKVSSDYMCLRCDGSSRYYKKQKCDSCGGTGNAEVEVVSERDVTPKPTKDG
jgi:DnaJ-class molecular chaperone